MTTQQPRRPRGTGGLWQKRQTWWLQYQGADGLRHRESSGSRRKAVAEALLRKRLGAVEHHLPIVPRAEQLTVHQAAQAVVDDFVANGKRSLPAVQRRITKHLLPYFGGRRLVGITSADVTAYIAKRQKDVIVTRRGTRPVSNAEINRELQVLKRMFNLAIGSGRIAQKPKITLLREAPARRGFFEPDQLARVLAHLPAAVRPVIQFAATTGWRIGSEVLPLEWRQVDFAASEVRLDPGTTKNREGRVFPMTQALRAVLEAQRAEHERVKTAGHLCPLVFFRLVAQGRGGPQQPKPITTFTGAWRVACRAAGCPGRIPHDLRRTAVRAFVRAGASEHVAMRLSGHKTRSVFDRYDIVSGDDLRAAARLLDVATGTAGR